MTKKAKQSIELGAKYPYDSVPPLDWAHVAAHGIVADLNDRSGIKNGFRGVDPDVRREIVESIAAIIRESSRDLINVAQQLVSLKYANQGMSKRRLSETLHAAAIHAEKALSGGR